MTGDKPKGPQKAEAPNKVVQGSFEERLRAASEQRAKVFAAKAAAQEAAEFAESAGSADSFETRPKRAADLFPRLIDASADVQVSKTPDDSGKLVSRLMLLSAFLVGAVAGCIGTIVWIKAVTLPGML